MKKHLALLIEEACSARGLYTTTTTDGIEIRKYETRRHRSGGGWLTRIEYDITDVHALAHIVMNMEGKGEAVCVYHFGENPRVLDILREVGFSGESILRANEPVLRDSIDDWND